jgi:hypothetical protein
VKAWIGLCCVALAAPAAAVPVPVPKSKLIVTEPVIEVLDPGGSTTVANVEDALTKLTPEFAKCGDDSKWTGDALVWLVTDWHGKVLEVKIAVEKTAVEKCLIGALKLLVVPHVHSRATTMMRLRVAPPAPTPMDPKDQLK